MHLYLISILFILVYSSEGVFAYDITNSPSFWLSKLENPDMVLMDEAGINDLNNKILESTPHMAEILNMGDTISDDTLKEYLLHDPLPKEKTMFDKNGKRIKRGFYEYIERNMNLEGIKEESILGFGVIAKTADIRAFPISEPLLKSPVSRDFDTAQYSRIYTPEPAALLHTSKDKRWGFFQTRFVRGWISLDRVAFVKDRTTIAPPDKEFLVVTGSFVNVYKDKWLKKFLERLPMGTRLYISGEDKDRWIAAFPYRGKDGILSWGSAYVSKLSDVSKGFLPYSQRNVIKQAFKMLGEGYGWGGINNRRDCSSFIKDIFAAFGINLPRNSKQQIRVGDMLRDFDNTSSHNEIKEALKHAVPVITLLGINGHIMLYLGEDDGTHYVIHALSRYERPSGFKKVERVAVTSMDIARGTKNGAYIDRLKGITILKNGEVKDISR